MRYVSDDGVEFSSEKECKDYEREYEKALKERERLKREEQELKKRNQELKNISDRYSAILKNLHDLTEDVKKLDKFGTINPDHAHLNPEAEEEEYEWYECDSDCEHCVFLEDNDNDPLDFLF